MLTSKSLQQIKKQINNLDGSIIQDWYRNDKGTNGFLGIGEYGNLYFIDYIDENNYLVEQSYQTNSGIVWEDITKQISLEF